MRTKFMRAEGQHRIFRITVWIGRAIGWTSLLVAILGIRQGSQPLSIMHGFELLPSLALGLMAVIWIAGLELFLRFFDRYLSRN